VGSAATGTNSKRYRDVSDGFESRGRGNGVRQRFVRVRPVEFLGSTRLEHREGGAHPLFVAEAKPGIFTSSWMIDTVVARKFLREIKRNNKRGVVLSLVVDTNVPGHPSLSMQLQEIFIAEG